LLGTFLQVDSQNVTVEMGYDECGSSVSGVYKNEFPIGASCSYFIRIKMPLNIPTGITVEIFSPNNSLIFSRPFFIFDNGYNVDDVNDQNYPVLTSSKNDLRVIILLNIFISNHNYLYSLLFNNNLF